MGRLPSDRKCPMGAVSVPQKTRLHLFPLSLPDELHASQIGRLHRDSGNAMPAHTYASVYGVPPFRLTQWIPSHLEEFAAKLDGSFIHNLHMVMRENTLFPLLQTFCGASLPEGLDVSQVRSEIAKLPRRQVGSSRKTNLCIECLKSDLDEFGTAYIHRSHQAPTTSVCWKHQTTLLDACPKCHFPFEPDKNLILAAWDPCPVCKNHLVELAEIAPKLEASERAIELAKFTNKILQTYSQSLSREVLSGLYFKRLKELGFMRGSRIDRQAIVGAMEAHYGAAMLEKTDLASQKGRSQNWFVMCSSYAIFEAPLSRHILLANFLYPDSSDLLDCATHVRGQIAAEANNLSADHFETSGGRQSMTRSGEKREKVKGTTNLLERTVRSRVLGLAQKYTKDQIKELWKNHHRFMKEFVKEDPAGLEWLQRQISSVEHVATPKIEVDAAIDLKWAKEFATIALDLYASTEKPVRVTLNQILKRSGWRGQKRPSLEQMPLAVKQLHSLIESEWHYWARRIIWAKITMESPPSSVSSLRIQAGVEHQRGTALARFFDDVPGNQVVWAGKVTSILEDYGIDKNWLGPEPDKEFHRAGRGYQSRAFPALRNADQQTRSVAID